VKEMYLSRESVRTGRAEVRCPGLQFLVKKNEGAKCTDSQASILELGKERKGILAPHQGEESPREVRRKSISGRLRVMKYGMVIQKKEK